MAYDTQGCCSAQFVACGGEQLRLQMPEFLRGLLQLVPSFFVSFLPLGRQIGI